MAWNEEFERLTNFTPSEIDYKFCHELFCGLQEYADDKWDEVCKRQCQFRNQPEPTVLRKVWINSKDQRGGDIKRLIDVYIFPFATEHEGRKCNYTLHILIDKEASHSLSYFDIEVRKNLMDELKKVEAPGSKK